MEYLRDAFMRLGLIEGWAVVLSIVIGLVIAYAVAQLIRVVGVAILARSEKLGGRWHVSLQERRVFRPAALALVILFTDAFVTPVLDHWPGVRDKVETVLDGLLVLAVAAVLSRLIAAGVDRLEKGRAGDKRLPVKALGQALQYTLWTYVAVVFLSVVTHRNVTTLLTGMTAVGAVLVYVFRDTILGWTASIQIAANDLARIGDWITVTQHGADGRVEEIALTTVKVRNWDKTTTTIPTYSLVSEGFRNWRGMFASDGRRIKRSLLIDLGSVRFCDEALIERLRRNPLMQKVLEASEEALANNDGKDPLSEPTLTNLTCYRRWLDMWLEEHPNINDSMAVMVRELQPGAHGIPVEIYVFSKDQRWEHYERLQADILDHMIAVLPEFGLKAYQERGMNDP